MVRVQGSSGRRTATGLLLAFLLAGCGAPDETASSGGFPPGSPAWRVAPATGPVVETRPGRSQVEIGNTHYLFVMGRHSVPELEAFLDRVDELTRSSPERYDHLNIALVIHGPSVEFFTREHFAGNRRLIDKAARLDARHVLDVKICQTSLDKAGISLADIPDFIEPVPFAPDEIERLNDEGYINL